MRNPVSLRPRTQRLAPVLGKLILVAAAVAAVACAQESNYTQSNYTQDGAYWVRTFTLDAPAHTGLSVSARAKIVLRGVPPTDGAQRIVYKLVQRVRARTEAEARRKMGEAVAVAGMAVTGDVTRVTVTPLAYGISSQVELYVPRRTSVAYLESQGGDIEAYDFDGSVNAETMFGQIRCDRIGGDVSGRTGGGRIQLGKIGGSVRCSTGAGSVSVESAGGETNCATAGGDMLVQEAGGPLTLSTEGNIRIGKAASTVEAHSAAGIIEVGSAGGVVTADTRGGSIQVGSARGVKAESARGGVRIKTASGPMSVSTAAGSIVAELLAGARLENSTLASGLGDISVWIPSNVGVTVMVRNDSNGGAGIVSEFPGVRVQNGLFQSPIAAQGAINGGGPMLFINAASGMIYLRKAK